jgi:hypothetical protein
MDCDALLEQQAGRNKARNPSAKVFVYRNIVKVCCRSRCPLTALTAPRAIRSAAPEIV